jgi:hypothetical protein
MFPEVNASDIKIGTEYKTTCNYTQYSHVDPHAKGKMIPITVYYRLVQRRPDGYLIYQFSEGKPCSTYGDQFTDALEHTAFFVTKEDSYAFLSDGCYACSEMYEHILSANKAGQRPRIAHGYPEDMEQAVRDELSHHVYFAHDDVFMFGNFCRSIDDMNLGEQREGSIVQIIGAHIDNSVKAYKAHKKTLNDKASTVMEKGIVLLEYLKEYNSKNTGYPINKKDIKIVNIIKNNIITPTDCVEIKILTSRNKKKYPDVMDWININYNTKKKCVTVKYGHPDKRAHIIKTITKPTDNEVSNMVYHLVELSKALDD